MLYVLHILNILYKLCTLYILPGTKNSACAYFVLVLFMDRTVKL